MICAGAPAQQRQEIRSPSASGVGEAFEHQHRRNLRRAGQQPLALASNVLQRPSGESIFALQRLMNTSGAKFRLTPEAIAMSLSPPRRLAMAR